METFPAALRARRVGRKVSQLELALRAGTTQRHVSFMESGRSAPGRSMVVRLAESLQLPLRERNDLLLAAGYAPVYPRTTLDDPALTAVRTALDRVLAGHMPYPAVIVDRRGELLSANAALDVLTEGADPALLKNVYRFALHPDGLAPRILNFSQWAYHVVDRLAQDETLADLHRELAEYLPERLVTADHLGFAVPVRLATSRGELRLTTTITTFATAVDVTLAELKLEAFLPADDATAEVLMSWPRGNRVGG
jgi:transcriptional regulator with XRE-family HTH domain